MKVLQIINTIGAGGAERLVAELSIKYKENGLDNKVYILKRVNNNFFEGILQSNNLSYNFSKRKSLKDFRHIIDIVRLIRKEKPDIVHTHLSYSFYYTALAELLLFKSKIKLVYTEHNTSNKRRENLLFKPIESFIYSLYAKIICISNDTEAMLRQWLDFKKNKLVRIYNGINVHKFKNASAIDLRKEHNLKADSKLLICVGSLSEQKNQELLIRALSRLESNYYILFIGRGVLKDHLVNLTKQLAVENRVFFLGLKPNVEVYYKSCDLFVLPSKWEGFGLVAAEAMAAGTPVLVSSVPGLSQLVGDAGFQFESENLEDLKTKIEYIFSNPDIVQTKVELAKERVKIFSIEKMAQNYLNEYNNLLSSNAKR